MTSALVGYPACSPHRGELDQLARDALQHFREPLEEHGWRWWRVPFDGANRLTSAVKLGKRLHEAVVGGQQLVVTSEDAPNRALLVALAAPDVLLVDGWSATRRLSRESVAELDPHRDEGSQRLVFLSEGNYRETLKPVKSPWGIGRYVAATSEQAAPVDDFGLLRSTHHQGVEDLIGQYGIVRVVAPSRTGKSYVSKQLEGSWTRKLCWRTELGDPSASARLPPWWLPWESGNDAALWIVDGLDEAWLHYESRVRELAGHVSRLENDKRGRLLLLLFQRDDHTVTPVGKCFGGVRDYRLLPIDAAEATRIAGGTDGLERAKRRARDLQRPTFVSIRDTLKCLAEPHETSDAARLMRQVLEAGVAGTPSERARAVDAAEELALAVALSGNEALSLEPSVEALTAGDLWERDERPLATLRRSGLVAEEGDRLRFREAHDQELCAALALHRRFADRHRRAGRLLCPSGELRDDLKGVADALATLSAGWKASVEGWRERKPPPVSPTELGNALDELEELHFEFVRHPALAYIRGEANETLCLERFRNASTTVPVQRFMLELAREHRWTRFGTAARQTLVDESAEPKLRLGAAYTLRELARANPEDPALAQDLELAPSESSVLEKARAVLLSAQLELGLRSAAETLKCAPTPEKGRVDARWMLIYQLEEEIDAPWARALLVSTEPLAKQLHAPALRTLMHETDWSAADATLIASAIDQLRFKVSLREELEGALEDGAARRALYPHAMGTSWRLQVSLSLVPSDASWLIGDEIQSSGARIADLTQLAKLGSEEAQEFLRENHPEQLEQLEPLAQKNRVPEPAEDESPACAPERDDLRPIGDVVEELLERPDATDRLVWLSVVCFGQRHERADVTGEFEDLTPEQQERVIAAFREELQTAEATTPPETHQSYPSRIWHEAAAFSYAVRWSETGWLSEQLIASWLPGLLFVGRHSSRNLQIGEVLRRCWQREPEATRRAILAAARREAFSSPWPALAENLPTELLDADLQSQLLDLAAEPRALDEHRARLLLNLWQRGRRQRARSQRARSQAVADAARKLLPSETETENSTQSGLTALGIRVAWQPESRLHRLQGRSSAELETALSPLVQGRWGVSLPRVDWKRWREENLDALDEILGEALGDFQLAYGEGGVVGPEERLNALRACLLDEIVERAKAGTAADSTGEEAWTRILERRPEDQRPFLQHRRDRRKVEAILDALAPPSPRPSRAEVLGIVRRRPDGTLYFHSEADLFEGLLELLEDIAADAPEHGELVLDTVSKKGSKLVVDGKKARHESALQAYLKLRLTERTRTSQPPLLLPRETQQDYQKKPDMVVETTEPFHAQIPIELKWLHSEEWKTGLETQLGGLYVNDERRPFGIYVVGIGPLQPKGREEKLRKALDAYNAKHEGRRTLGLVFLRFVPEPASR